MRSKAFTPAIFLAVALLLTPILSAQTMPLSCADAEGLVVFGNGINTQFHEAVASQKELELALKERLTSEEFGKLQFAVAYNTTAGFWLDVLESAVQDITTDVSQLWRYWLNVLPMPEGLRLRIEQRIGQFDAAALVTTDSLQSHVSIYRTAILEGKKVLLVAHSQGTFYANQAHSLLTNDEQRSFGIVAVAEMDSYVAGGGEYTTLFEDLAVAIVALAKQTAGLPGPLFPNTTNVLFNGDALGHGFVSSYLDGWNSRPSIQSQCEGTLGRLTVPDGAAGQGVITVTLTWGAQPDVDLHVFEPNGTHVYYSNLRGSSGYLDLDDVDGYGPEHYYVSCDTLESGTYAVGVNYYYGAAPELARVQVKAGLDVRTFEVPLASSLGSAGNASPVPVANINVVADPSGGGYRFTIVPRTP